MVVAGLALTVREFAFGNADVHGLAWGVVSGFAFAWLVVRTRVYLVDAADFDKVAVHFSAVA